MTEEVISFYLNDRISLNQLKLQIDRRINKIIALSSHQLIISNDQGTQTMFSQNQQTSKVSNCQQNLKAAENIAKRQHTLQNPEIESDDGQKNELVSSQDKFFENSHVEIQKMINSCTKPSSVKRSQSDTNSRIFSVSQMVAENAEIKLQDIAPAYQTPQKNTVFLSMTRFNKHSEFTAYQRDRALTSRILNYSNKAKDSRNRIRVSDCTKLKAKREVERIVSEDRRQISCNKVRQNLLKRIIEKSRILFKMQN